MTARTAKLEQLPGDVLLEVSRRILAAPSSNVQRVSMNEIYSFALALPALVAIGDLTALHLAGAPGADAQLRGALAAAGFIDPEESTHG